MPCRAISSISTGPRKLLCAIEELVTKRYLRKVPPDPITESTESWVIVPPPDEPGQKKVWDIRSGAEGQGLNGSDYSTW